MSKKVSHIDLREAASNVTPPITAKPSSSLLTTGLGGINANSVNLKQSSTHPVLAKTDLKSTSKLQEIDSNLKVGIFLLNTC